MKVTSLVAFIYFKEDKSSPRLRGSDFSSKNKEDI